MLIIVSILNGFIAIAILTKKTMLSQIWSCFPSFKDYKINDFLFNMHLTDTHVGMWELGRVHIEQNIEIGVTCRCNTYYYFGFI